MKKVVLRNISKPTDIIIVGTEMFDDHDFALADDYTSFYISKDGKDYDYCDCDGLVSIVYGINNFKKEFERIAEENGETVDEYFENIDCFLLPQFTGEIALRVSSNKNFLDTSMYVDLDYIYNSSMYKYQDDVDAFINLPVDTEIVEISQGNYNNIMTLENRKTILKKINDI